jgi:hypothetical protein
MLVSEFACCYRTVQFRSRDARLSGCSLPRLRFVATLAYPKLLSHRDHRTPIGKCGLEEVQSDEQRE